MSVFEKLSKTDMRKHVKKKGNQSYLSWGHAWAAVKQSFPDANRTVYEDQQTGLNFFTDGNTAYVKVGVTIGGQEHIDYLPVMDHRNNSIQLDKVTSFDVNKTIQRSTVKAIAMHGLGLELWIGEDVPELQAKPQTQPQEYTLDIGDGNWDKVLGYMADQNKKGAKFEDVLKQLGTKYKLTKKVESELKKQYK